MTSCAARLQSRKPIVERHEIMELLAQLKLAGMRAAYDEVVAAGVRAQHSFQRIFGELLLAQLADNRARSTALLQTEERVAWRPPLRSPAQTAASSSRPLTNCTASANAEAP